MGISIIKIRRSWDRLICILGILLLVRRHIYIEAPPGACPTKYRIDQIRSNSNFAWNSYRCAFEDSRPIITKFGTRHDSRTVVTCTKFRYDRPTIIEIRGTRIFSKFWIRSNLSIRYLVRRLVLGTKLKPNLKRQNNTNPSLSMAAQMTSGELGMYSFYWGKVVNKITTLQKHVL